MYILHINTVSLGFFKSIRTVLVRKYHNMFYTDYQYIFIEQLLYNECKSHWEVIQKNTRKDLSPYEVDNLFINTGNKFTKR